MADLYQTSAAMAVPQPRRKPRLSTDSWESNADNETDAEGFRRELVQGNGEVANKALTPRGGKAAAFMAAGQPTQLPNDRAGRVTIMGNDPMTQEQRGTVVGMAREQDGYHRPLRGSINGQEFEMPASGPRVSQAKAQSFLQLAAQERAMQEAKAEKDRTFQADRIDKQAANDRQTRMDDNASADRNQNRKMAYDANLRQNDESAYTFGQRKKVDARTEAMQTSPEMQRQMNAAQTILDSPGASPKAKAMATRMIAQASGIRGDLADEVGRVPVSAASQPIRDAIDQVPAISSHLQTVKTLISEAQDLPWMRDVDNIGRLLTGEEQAGADEPKVAAVKDAFDRAVAMVMQTVPGSDEETVRATIASQIAGDAKANTTVNHQLRSIWSPRQQIAQAPPMARPEPSMGNSLADMNPAF